MLVAVGRFPVLGAADCRTLRSESYTRVRKKFVPTAVYMRPFRPLLGDVRRGFTERLAVVLHSTFGSYLRDALHEGGAAAVACLHAPRASLHLPPFSSSVVLPLLS